MTETSSYSKSRKDSSLAFTSLKAINFLAELEALLLAMKTIIIYYLDLANQGTSVE
jgi:hypothetical protein